MVFANPLYCISHGLKVFATRTQYQAGFFHSLYLPLSCFRNLTVSKIDAEEFKDHCEQVIKYVNQRVLDIATELVESGIDVILDKWNLKEGDDADVFMEQMIADPTIQKVLIICDKMYSEKSDKRKGGAGTEAQIISRKVYEQQQRGCA